MLTQWLIYLFGFRRHGRESVDKDIVDRTAAVLIVVALGHGVRTVLLKYAMSNVLRRSYAEKTEQAIVYKYLARVLTCPDGKSLGNHTKIVEGKGLRLLRDSVFLHTCTSGVLRKVEKSTHTVHSYLRILRREGLLMYDGKGKLKKVRNTLRVNCV